MKIKIIKTIASVFILNFLTALTLIFIIIFIIINKESNKIIKKEDGYYLRPKRITQMPEEMTLLEFFYIWMFNKTFDLTYFKIKNKNKWIIIELIKNINLKDLFFRIFLNFIGINKLFLKMMNILWNKKNINEYIFKSLYKEKDGRLILKINGKWKTNGNQKRIMNHLKNEIKFIDEKKSEKLVEKWFSMNEKIQSNKILNFSLIDVKDINSPHYATKEILKNNKNYMIITDYQKALNKNLYERKVLLNKVLFRKESIGLQINEEDFSKIHKKSVFVPEQKIIKSAVEWGHSEDFTDNIEEKISNYKTLKTIIYQGLKDLGMEDWKLNEQGDKVLEYLDNDLIDLEINSIIKEIRKF